MQEHKVTYSPLSIESSTDAAAPARTTTTFNQRYLRYLLLAAVCLSILIIEEKRRITDYSSLPTKRQDEATPRLQQQLSFVSFNMAECEPSQAVFDWTRQNSTRIMQ